MSSLLNKLSLLMHAEANEAADTQLSKHSIPVLTQQITDIEASLATAKHQAAVAAATVTTYKERATTLQDAITTDTQRAAAWVAQGNTDMARQVGERVIKTKADLTALENQITMATTASQRMDSAVQTFQTKHDDLVSTLRNLRTEDGNAKAVEGMTASLKSVESLTNSVDPTSLTNAAENIHQRDNVAQEEFNRTINSPDFKPEVDPLQNAAVDDFLKSLSPAPTAAAATAGGSN
jgi:phage shock protein A